ncbi:hypothetical protein B5X24_HaOG207804 [Helicoverpa armigera]|nr:hypothetical protein B5X24_HaOG207804 [Helicoverpa armigera]
MSTKNSAKSDRKISEKVICFKCKKSVDIRKTALCSTCNNRYEPDCDGYPEQTYRLMDQESKKKWRCKLCKKKGPTIDPISDISNITTRKRPNLHFKNLSPGPGPSDNFRENKQFATATLKTNDILDPHILSENESSDETFDTPNKLSHSVDGTISEISETLTVLEMKNTIEVLTLKLDSAENELENTLLENSNLNQQINKLTAEIKMLKSLCYSPITSENSPAFKQKRKRLSLLPQNSVSTPCTPLPNKTNIDFYKSIEVISLQQKIADLQQNLKEAQQQIETLTKTMETMQRSNITARTSTEALLRSNHGTTNTTSNLDAPTYSEEQKHEPTSRVFIFGSQQCVGLAAAMIHSRQNTRYEKYTITANTKPNALSSQIIMSCRYAKLNHNDKLVICLGENDHNLNYVLSQLQTILDTFYNNMTIVLNVFKNEFFDVNKLNYRLKNVCINYKKCKFLECKSNNISELCTKINYLIDYNDYYEKYLDPRNLVNHMRSNKSSANKNIKLNKPKKGTIPFYFDRVSLSRQQSEILITSTEKPKKGTIPYYFPVIKNNSKLFRVRNSEIS